MGKALDTLQAVIEYARALEERVRAVACVQDSCARVRELQFKAEGVALVRKHLEQTVENLENND